MPTDRRPHVTVIQTGGTIGSAGRDADDRLEYVDLARLLTDDEAAALYRLPSDVDVTFTRLSSMRSNDADASFWARARAAVMAALADPAVDGVVLTHGTATLEETAFVLHLTVATDKPVVVVGAQRPPTAVGSDASVNLSNAVLVAASPSARGAGVLVVMDDMIFSARDVTKAENSRLHTFQASSFGALGEVGPSRQVHFERTVLRHHTTASELTDVDLNSEMPRVELATMYAGVDRAVVDSALARGAQGLVVAGLAPGMNPALIETAIDDAIGHGVRVVQASRGRGRVVERPAFAGRRLIAAGTMSPQVARIFLQLTLLAGWDHERTRRGFEVY